MELYDQIRKISFIFFIALGLAHFLAGLLFVNEFFEPHALLVNRVLIIPFVITAFTYVYSNTKYQLHAEGKNDKIMPIVILIIGVIVVAGLIAGEFLLPDSTTPLSPPIGL